MFRKEIGIDIGTTQITICSAEGGLLYRGPSVAAIDVDGGEILEAGNEALALVKAAPERATLCWPVWDRVVKSANVLSAILRTFLRRALGRTLFRPVAMVCIPCDLTEAQVNAVEDAVLAAGVSRVHLLEAPLCATLGVGFDFSVPKGRMVIHMGASRVEAAVVFLGDMVVHKTTHVAGQSFDLAIVEYMQKAFNMKITRRTAEQIKIRIARVVDHNDVKYLDVKGRDIQTGERRVQTLASKDMMDVLKDVLVPVIDVAYAMVENTVEEMRADIAAGGVVLTGGGILSGVAQLLADALGVRVSVAANAETAAAEGAARALARLR